MYKKIIKEVARELDLPETLVNDTYKAFWKYIKDTIQELPLKKNLSEKDYEELRTNFNIPSLGKFSCSFDRYKNIRKRFKYIESIRNND